MWRIILPFPFTTLLYFTTLLAGVFYYTTLLADGPLRYCGFGGICGDFFKGAYY
jgi:hypothetical protein